MVNAPLNYYQDSVYFFPNVNALFVLYDLDERPLSNATPSNDQPHPLELDTTNSFVGDRNSTEITARTHRICLAATCHLSYLKPLGLKNRPPPDSGP